jgi:hypothetical protein
MAQQIGEAFENLARVSASTAHLFRSIELGSQPGNVQIDPNSFREEFKSLVQEYSQPPGRNSAPQQQPAQPAQREEESKAPSQPVEP